MVEYISALYGLYSPEVKSKLEGQGMVEYALILVLVSVVAIAALGFLGGKITGVFSSVTSQMVSS